MAHGKEKDEKPARVDPHEGYSGFGHYMAVKQEKLRRQQVEGLTQYSALFKGMIFYVNGRTNPPQHELKDLIVQHGGVFEQYYRSDVTHMIASVLPDTKIRQLSKNELIMRPEWITDSIAAGQLLPMAKYQLYANRNDVEGQLKLPIHKSHDVPKSPSDSDSDGDGEASVDDDHPEMAKPIIDCNDPQFIESFYRNSRLHHLSTWREDLKQFAEELMSSKEAPLPGDKGDSWIAHVDMDCFFASVGIRDRPELKDKPVAITHAHQSSSKVAPEDSSSDLASCNYVARQVGVKNGMWIRDARKLCPDLVLLPYEFDKYHAISLDLYRILAASAIRLTAVSCDEAFLEIKAAGQDEALAICSQIRQRIRETTGCPASIGISSNMLLARLATKKAKPDGIWLLSPDQIDEFMAEQKLSDIPGIGWSLAEKLADLGWSTCADVQRIPLGVLQSHFGDGVGKNLYDHVRGIDDRPVGESQVRKSVGCDINWAIRFQSVSQVHTFLERLAQETFKRQTIIRMIGTKIQLKVLKRKAGEGEPSKRLGCGRCDTFSRSKTLVNGVDAASLLAKEAIRMFNSLDIAPEEVRGLGILIQDLKACELFEKSRVISMRAFMSEAPSNDPLEAKLRRLGYDRAIFEVLPDDIKEELLNPPSAIPGTSGALVPVAPAPKPLTSPSKPSKRTSPEKKRIADPDQPTLTQLFAKRKTPIVSAYDDHLPPGLDKEFLKALPKEIRAEILASHSTTSLPHRLNETPRNPANLIEIKHNKAIPLPPFNGCTGIAQIEAWLRDRLRNCSPPVAGQVILDCSPYLTELLHQGFTQQAYTLIEYINILIGKDEYLREFLLILRDSFQVAYRQVHCCLCDLSF